MTDEVGTMREAIRVAIEDFLARKGGGFQCAFVYAVDVVDADGTSAVYLGGPVEQETYKSLGLTAYLGKWFDDEAREMIAQSAGPCSCGECDEDED